MSCWSAPLFAAKRFYLSPYMCFITPSKILLLPPLHELASKRPSAFFLTISVHFPAPKTHILLDSDTPVFATGKGRLTYVRGGTIDEQETEMMSVCWNEFSFTHQIPEDQQIRINPCPRCFAILVSNMQHNNAIF